MISIRPTLTIFIIIIVTTMIIIQKPSRPKKQNARSLGPVMIIVSPRAHYLPCPHPHSSSLSDHRPDPQIIHDPPHHQHHGDHHPYPHKHPHLDHNHHHDAGQ